MFRKSLLSVVTLLVIAISGCTANRNDSPWASARPLGRDFSTYQATDEASAKSMDAPSIAEPVGVVTLQQSLAYALLNNPELAVYAWEMRVAEAGEMQASLLPNPEIEVEVEEFGGTGERRGFQAAGTTLQLSQLIELGNKRSRRMLIASLQSRLVGWDYEAKRLEVFGEVANAFVDVLAAQRQLGLADELARLAEEVLTTVAQQVEAGKDSPVEQTKAQVALSMVRIEKKNAYQHLASARKQLAATWGSKSAAFEQVTGQFEEILPVPSESQLLQLLTQNPDIARWAVEMEQRRAIWDLEKARAVPDPSVLGGIQHFNETDDTSFVFGFSIPLPLFDRNQAEVLAAQHNIAKAQQQRRAAELAVYTAVVDAYQRLSSAFTQVADLKTEVLPGAQSAFDAVTQGYRQGKFNYLDVLDAQQTLFEAKGQYVQSLAVYHKGRVEMERLIGQGIDTITDIPKP
ncbi:MAG: TolC family protein [Sedimentisphaerales bacterium]|nr:TolC family protein [Sedimentisphaerales bacterium]